MRGSVLDCGDPAPLFERRPIRAATKKPAEALHPTKEAASRAHSTTLRDQRQPPPVTFSLHHLFDGVAGTPRSLLQMRLIVLGLVFAAPLPAADWPMWRGNAMHSGATEQSLPKSLGLKWSRFVGKPDPAFDYHFRLCADQGPEPVAAGGRLFVPSNTQDSVTAFDLASGEAVWSVITEGPVRFAPVVVGDTVCFGSDDGHLYCVDADSGSLKWKARGAPGDRPDHRMLVNGRMSSRWPVRGGPVLQDGTVYFGCGIWPAEGVFLVAVDAASGEVRWRNAEIAQINDGLEEHGKMADIGLPPHGYLAILGGKVALPSGRALAAFADPATGTLDPYNSFYAKYYPAPRGMWAIGGNADFWFQGGALMGTNPKTLELLPVGPMPVAAFAELAGQTVPWVEDKIRRGFVKVTEKDGQRLVTADPRSPQVALNIKAKDVSPAQMFQLAERPVLNMSITGTRHEVGERGMPVFTNSVMYRSEFKDPMGVEVERGMTRVAVPNYDVIRAYDLSDPTWKIDIMASKRVNASQRHLDFKVLWELDVTGLTVKLVAGDRLYAAGANKIVAIDLPQPGAQPIISWEQKVHGYPIGVLAASDHLVVTTDTGRLYAFGENAPTEASEPLVAKKEPASRFDDWRAFLAKRRGEFAPEGYALVLGWNTGELAQELAIQTKLNVIVVEPNPETAKDARATIAKLGWPGSRLQILTGDATSLRLPPYFAQVVTTESFTPLNDGARIWTRMAVESLRPHTGIGLLSLRPKLLEEAQTHAETFGGYTFETADRWTTIRRIAAPKGADNWTHEHANGGNTFASVDALAKPPFGVLWYSGEIDREFSPAFEFHHNRNPYPVIAEGRMFMLESHRLHCADVYTGRHLWKADIPESAKSERRLDDHRTHSRATDQNLIATNDLVYVLREDDAQVFDAATGELVKVLTVPTKFRGETGEAVWDEVRIEGDLLYVAVANHLVALDRHNGEVKWSHDSGRSHVAFGLGNGQAYIIDYTTARAQDPAKTGAFDTKVQVLDAATGEAFWSEPLSAPERPEQSERSAGRPQWAGIFQDNPLKPTVHYNAAHNVLLTIVDRHQFQAFDAQSGSRLWHYDSGTRLTDLVTFEPPTVTSQYVVCDDGVVLDVQTGLGAGPEAVGARGTGCNRFVGNDALVTFRSALACYLDLETNERTYMSSTRPGCTNSMIPAAGLLNAPNFAHGCVCNYPFLTSFSLFHLPEAAKWAPKVKADVQTQSNPNAD